MRPLKSILLALGAVAVVGCDGPKPVAAAPARAPAPKPVEVVEQAPPPAAETLAHLYAYNPLGKRDPYRLPEEIAPSRAADVNRECADPLCQWDLDQLTLTAVVTGDANPFGMLLDPQGRGHIVRRNTRVGRQGGRVTQILRDGLVVTEYWNQPDGKRASIPKNIRMRQEGGNLEPAQDLLTGRLFE